MFVEIQKDKIRSGLLGLRRLMDSYAPLVSFELRCVGYMVDDEMVGVVVFGGGRIFSLAVAENHRGCGYGHKLFEYVSNSTERKDVTIYVPRAFHRTVAAFINWGCYFDGFYSDIDSKTKFYRLVYGTQHKLPTVDYYDNKLWEDSATLAEEAVVAFNVGSVM